MNGWRIVLMSQDCGEPVGRVTEGHVCTPFGIVGLYRYHNRSKTLHPFLRDLLRSKIYVADGAGKTRLRRYLGRA